MKKVLIIGAGIGGLSTAVRLLSKGYEVEILEKQKTLLQEQLADAEQLMAERMQYYFS